MCAEMLEGPFGAVERADKPIGTLMREGRRVLVRLEFDSLKKGVYLNKSWGFTHSSSYDEVFDKNVSLARQGFGRSGKDQLDVSEMVVTLDVGRILLLGTIRSETEKLRQLLWR
jgi:hypothetical protein